MCAHTKILHTTEINLFITRLANNFFKAGHMKTLNHKTQKQQASNSVKLKMTE